MQPLTRVAQMWPQNEASPGTDPWAALDLEKQIPGVNPGTQHPPPRALSDPFDVTGLGKRTLRLRQHSAPVSRGPRCEMVLGEQDRQGLPGA